MLTPTQDSSSHSSTDKGEHHMDSPSDSPDSIQGLERSPTPPSNYGKGKNILLNTVRYYIHRWKARNTWWVVRYQIENRYKESGVFASLEKTYSAACEDAAQHIQKIAVANGDCKYTVKRPGLRELFFQ